MDSTSGTSPSQTAPTALPGDAAYALKASENGRYFVDQNGAPVFWLGTTQWHLFRDNTLEEAMTIPIHPMVAHDYQLAPAKPVQMAEGAYEAGSEYALLVLESPRDHRAAR